MALCVVFNFNASKSRDNNDTNSSLDSSLSNFNNEQLSSSEAVGSDNNTTTIESHLSDIVLRTISRTDPIYNSLPKPYGMNYRVQMDYSAFLNKPFYVSSGEWKTSDTRLSKLEAISFPKGVISVSAFTAVPFLYSCYYRAKAKVIIHLNGTPMHSGVIVATSMPPFTDTALTPQHKHSINPYIQAPHQFLYANQSSAVEVEVPMFTNFPVARTTGLDASSFATGTSVTGDQEGSMCEVLLFVLNPLKTTGGSTTIRYTVHCIFEELEFFVPTSPKFNSESLVAGIRTTTSGLIDGVFKNVGTWARTITTDALDSTRQAIRAWTGLHSPNKPIMHTKNYVQGLNNLNITDAPVVYDKIDPYLDYTRICDDTYFKTNIDEGDMTYLCGKYQHIGTFGINSNTTTGTLLFSRPICPFQEVVSVTDGSDNPTYSVIEKLALLATHWRGDLEVKIQSSMTNFQNCKLYVVLDYSKSSYGMTNVPSYVQASGMITHTFEFSGGGTNIEFTLPYISEYPHLPCTPDWLLQALSHGVYRIYLLQPLVSADSQPTTAEFNVYVRGKPSFQLFGYSVWPFTSAFGYAPTNKKKSAPVTTPSPIAASSAPTTTAKPRMSPGVGAGVRAPRNAFEGAVDLDAINTQSRFHSECKKFYPETLTNVTASIIDSNTAGRDRSDNPKTESFNPVSQIRPLVNIRDITRRMYDVYTLSLQTREATGSTFVLHLSDLIAGTHQGDLPLDHFAPLHVARMLYHGFRGGLKVHIQAMGAVHMQVRYFPPQATTKKQTIQPSGKTFYTMWDSRIQPTSTFINCSPPVVNAHYHQSGSANGPKIFKDGSTMDGTSNSICVAEVEIPFMSACDFVGSINSVAPISDTSLEIDALGYLEIQAQNDTVSYTDDSDPPVTKVYNPSLYVKVCIGFSDESRLGMAVYSPPLFLPTKTVILPPPGGTTTYLDLPYKTGDNVEWLALKTVAAPKAYFTLAP